MTLSVQQRASLRRQGITVLIEYGNSSVKCMTANGERLYTQYDLQQISKPGFADRFTAWVGRNKSA